MFAYLNGTLEEIDQNKIVLDVNGVGYSLTVPEGVVERLPNIGSDIKLYTYLAVREDAQELYGFIDKSQKAIFEKLITVSGIGPKGGLSILSTLNADEVVAAIMTEDIASLTKAPGVGRKTAQRIILDLKDKMDELDIIGGMGGLSSTLPEETKYLGEVAQALTALGYNQSEVKRAIAGIEDIEGDTSTLIKAALKNLDI